MVTEIGEDSVNLVSGHQFQAGEERTAFIRLNEHQPPLHVDFVVRHIEEQRSLLVNSAEFLNLSVVDRFRITEHIKRLVEGG
jgi:hypothetical protein